MPGIVLFSIPENWGVWSRFNDRLFCDGKLASIFILSIILSLSTIFFFLAVTGETNADGSFLSDETSDVHLVCQISDLGLRLFTSELFGTSDLVSCLAPTISVDIWGFSSIHLVTLSSFSFVVFGT